MAWEFDGGYLAPGARITWAYWWGGDPHDYMGIQVVQARPERRGWITVIAGQAEADGDEPGPAAGGGRRLRLFRHGVQRLRRGLVPVYDARPAGRLRQETDP